MPIRSNRPTNRSPTPASFDFKNTDFRQRPDLYRTKDAGKAQAAAVFYKRYVAARQHPEYVRQKKLHKQKYEGV